VRFSTNAVIQKEYIQELFAKTTIKKGQEVLLPRRNVPHSAHVEVIRETEVLRKDIKAIKKNLHMITDLKTLLVAEKEALNNN